MTERSTDWLVFPGCTVQGLQRRRELDGMNWQEAEVPTSDVPACVLQIDLSRPDNTELVRGRPLWMEALWFFFASPLLRASVLPWSSMRVVLLRWFGAKVGTGVYIKPGIRVKFPWYLSIGDYSWIGEDTWIDNLAPVFIGSHVCVSQGVYLCTGNHDWSTSNMRLFVKPIRLEAGCWIGARSVVCPGVTVGEGAVLTVASVAHRQIPPFEVHCGNPAQFSRRRQIRTSA